MSANMFRAEEPNVFVGGACWEVTFDGTDCFARAADS